MIGGGDDGAASQRDVGEPGEVVVAVGPGLAALEAAEGVVLVVEAVDLGELLEDVPIALLGSVPGFEVSQGLVFGEEGRKRAFLEGDDEVPPVALAEGEDCLIGVEGIEEQEAWEARVAGVEFGGEPPEGLQFAVLLRGARVAVLDEHGGEREGEPVGGHKLCLQDVVEVERFAVGGLLGEAMRAMALSEEQLPSPVHSHRGCPEDPPPVEGLHADEPLGHGRGEFLKRLRRERLEVVDDGVVVGRHRNRGLGHRVEVGHEGLRLRLQAQLPPGPQAQEEHLDRRPHERLLGIVELVRVAAVWEGPYLPGKVRQEVPQRPGEGVP